MKTQHDVLMEDPEFRRLLAEEALVAEASELIARLMAEQGLNKSDLARRLNKSRAWVTQMLSGRANLTVRTLAEVVHALDAEVKLQAQTPKWKTGDRPKSSGWQPVVYRSGPYELGRPVAENIFRLDDEELRPETSEGGDGDPLRPGYAA